MPDIVGLEHIKPTSLQAIADKAKAKRTHRFGNLYRELNEVLFTDSWRRLNKRVEADIKGFFNHLDHDWLLTMLRQRVEDESFLALIKKWLKAGILERTGKVVEPTEGSPQGGVISPVLANIYLHYVLDLWFEKVVKRHCRGKAMFIRYCDDFVCAF